MAAQRHLLRGLCMRQGVDWDSLTLVDRMDVAWSVLVEWQPEVQYAESDVGLLVHSADRRLRAWQLADKLAEPPAPLRSAWGGPDPAHADSGKISVPPSPRTRKPAPT